MVENPLAFEFSKTRAICDAFDVAWALSQGLGSDLTQAAKSLATQTILAKRIMKMADQGLRDIPALRDDALAFLQHSPPSASRDGLGEAIKAPAGRSPWVGGYQKGTSRKASPASPATPFSLQMSQKSVALSLDSAEARVGRPCHWHVES